MTPLLRAQTTYQLVVHNVSTEELAEGREAYSIVSVDFEEGRISLNKGNIVKHMYSYWFRELKPLAVPWDHVLKYMLHSGTYCPSPVWASSKTGAGMDFDKLNALMNCVCTTAPASIRCDPTVSNIKAPGTL